MLLRAQPFKLGDGVEAGAFLDAFELLYHSVAIQVGREVAVPHYSSLRVACP